MIHRIGVGYGNEQIIFSLRSITAAEENRYTNRFLEISAKLSEERRIDEEYKIYAESLAAWSDSVPMKRNGTGEETPLFEGDMSPAEAVNKYLADPTDEKFRMIRALIGNYRTVKLVPDVVFY